MGSEIDPRENDVRWVKLPTGKPHVSWSETRSYRECGFRHRLAYVEKIDLSQPSSVLAFGHAVHFAIEKWLPTRASSIDASAAHDALRVEFEQNVGKKSFEPETLALMLQQATDILSEVPSYLDATFPGWEPVEAEHKLYEPVGEKKPQHAFKGFIDAVIRAPGKRGETLTWLIDHKTVASFWSAQKRSDPLVTGQLASYKNYWLQERGELTPEGIKNTRCAFLLLYRNAKPGKRCELVPVSVGEKALEKTLKVINDCVGSISRGVALKNRESCRYCDYRGTEHCP